MATVSALARRLHAEADELNNMIDILEEQLGDILEEQLGDEEGYATEARVDKLNNRLDILQQALDTLNDAITQLEDYA